jgi:hypothetical protein
LLLSRWGIFSIALFAGVFGALAVCNRIFHDREIACMVLYVFLRLSAVGFGSVAAARGSKWWLLIPLLSGLLAAQAILALFVGDVG